MRQFAILLWVLFFLGGPGHLPAAASNDPGAEQLVARLEMIKTKMKRIRFCYNDNCSYRKIESAIVPPAVAGEPYTATITAVVDRPGALLDTADYHFQINGDRWQLIGGEEYSDVADYVFKGDRYEIYSIHAHHTFQGDLMKAKEDGNLKSGYLALYFDVLDRGSER